MLVPALVAIGEDDRWATVPVELPVLVPGLGPVGVDHCRSIVPVELSVLPPGLGPVRVEYLRGLDVFQLELGLRVGLGGELSASGDAGRLADWGRAHVE